MDKELAVIQTFLQHQIVSRQDVVCGSGDDAAVVDCKTSKLVTTVDSQIYQTHFDDRFSAVDVGYKSLAVNLSDFAAMGAKPKWALISLTLPKADLDWVAKFSQGFVNLANIYNIECVGGNVAKGALGAHITLLGTQEQNRSLYQDQAQINDLVVVTGDLGGAAWAWQNHTPQTLAQQKAYQAWLRPSLVVKFAYKAVEYINAAVDISDGLYPDLMHILNKSKLGVILDLDACPYHQVLAELDPQVASNLAWNGGESYQLCFTCKADNLQKISSIATACKVRLSVVGKITSSGFVWQNSLNRPIPKVSYYQHF